MLSRQGGASRRSSVLWGYVMLPSACCSSSTSCQSQQAHSKSWWRSLLVCLRRQTLPLSLLFPLHLESPTRWKVCHIHHTPFRRSSRSCATSTTLVSFRRLSSSCATTHLQHELTWQACLSRLCLIRHEQNEPRPHNIFPRLNFQECRVQHRVYYMVFRWILFVFAAHAAADVFKFGNPA